MEEYISLIAAAQRLGCTVEEVEQLIKGKKLESKTEYGRTQVTKQSVYDLSGLKNDGRQTAKKRGPKRARMSFAQDDAGCGVSTKSVKAAKGEEKPAEAEADFVPYGIKEEPCDDAGEKHAGQTAAAAGEKDSATHERILILAIAGGDGAFTKDDIKEAADIAYRLGKLAVYESLDNFERRAV